MCIHMIMSILRVILSNEDGHLRPEFAMREQVDNLAQCQVVVGNIRSVIRVAIFRPRRCRVIIGQPDVYELRQRLKAASIELAQTPS